MLFTDLSPPPNRWVDRDALAVSSSPTAVREHKNAQQMRRGLLRAKPAAMAPATSRPRPKTKKRKKQTAAVSSTRAGVAE